MSPSDATQFKFLENENSRLKLKVADLYLLKRPSIADELVVISLLLPFDYNATKCSYDEIDTMWKCSFTVVNGDICCIYL